LLLGVAALILAGAAFLSLIGQLLVVIDGLQNHVLAGSDLANGFGFLDPLLSVAAFSLAGAAFLAGSAQLFRRLGFAAIVIGVASVASLAGDGINFGMEVAHDFPGTYSASDACSAASDLLTAAAAITVAVAFLGFYQGTPADRRSLRDTRLGSAAILFGVASVLSLSAGILLVVFLSDYGATGGLTSGFGIASGGAAVEGVAAAIAAVGFFSARRKANHVAIRDRLLAFAAATFGLALLITAIGGLIGAGAASANGFDGKAQAQLWLVAIGALVSVGAAACASVGFFRSRPTSAAAG
jgi:hypothetical protein